MNFKDLQDEINDWDEGSHYEPCWPAVALTRKILGLYQACSTCNGTGRLVTITRGGLLSKGIWEPCPDCGSTGVQPKENKYALLWLAKLLFGDDGSPKAGGN